MQWFKNLSTALKILSLVALLLLLLAIVSLTGYSTSKRISRSMDFMYRNYATPAIGMTDVKARAIQNRRFILSMLVSRSSSEKTNLENRFMENRTKIAQILSTYESTNVSDEEKSLLSEFQAVRGKVLAFQNEALSVIKSGGATDKILERVSEGGDMAAADDAYIALTDRFAKLLNEMSDGANDEAGATANKAATSIAILALVAILFGLLLTFFIARMITGPLGRIQKTVAVFADGNLDCTFESAGRDEIARMGRSLQEMADNLSHVIASVKSAGGDISETAHEFSALAQETNASVEEFRSNVEEMGANLNSLAASGQEVNASVEEVASGAQATAERGTTIARKVDDAMKAGENGMTAVRRTTLGIEDMARDSAETATLVQELGSRTRQIQGFVSQIGGIADQTNLLALNAAIEAARAGDAGRGFAVVAEEVRKLAEESNVAAKNIAELASTITGQLDKVVTMAQKNASTSGEASTLTRETETTIGSMIGYLRDIASSTQDLAAVAQEQAASSEEIAETIQNMATRVNSTAEAGDNIRNGVGEVAAAAERVALGAENLSSLAENMQSLLAFFKTQDARQPKQPKLALKR